MFRKIFSRSSHTAPNFALNTNAIKIGSHQITATHSINEHQHLICTLNELLLVEDSNIVARYNWNEFSLARWEETGRLVYIFHDGRPNLEFACKEAPSSDFLEMMREGIMETQVFAGVIHLPSGAEITARVLRDTDRIFRVFPSPSSFTNLDDQDFLRDTYRQWESKLGIELTLQ